MKKTYERSMICFLLSGVCLALFVILLCLLLTTDLAPVGAGSTVVGLAGLNVAMHKLFGEHLVFYTLTYALGVAAIALAGAFAVWGVVQAIRRKSLLKVDKEIWALGAVFLLVIALYLLFEIAVVNARPILMPGKTEPEASFPSSHTLVICTVFSCAAMLYRKIFRSRALRVALQALSAAVVLFTALGRLLSGVHWFTDILGGLLLSGTLIFLFAAVLPLLENKREAPAPQQANDPKEPEESEAGKDPGAN